jgi:phosphatidylserine/phosphatidylglycerophosphate/cardiolipin synthase-like enzyme
MAFELIDTAWDKIIDRAVAARSPELRVICPFIKRKVAERLLRGPRLKSIQVLTRFHLGDFYDGVSDTEALQLFLESGAQIRGVKNLHAKLYLFGRKQVVTSANLTERALLHNHEFGFVSDEFKIITSCHEYFDRLWKLAQPDLTAAKLAGWEKHLANARAGQTPSPKGPRWPDHGTNCGFGVDTSAPFIPPVFAEASKGGGRNSPVPEASTGVSKERCRRTGSGTPGGSDQMSDCF